MISQISSRQELRFIIVALETFSNEHLSGIQQLQSRREDAQAFCIVPRVARNSPGQSQGLHSVARSVNHRHSLTPASPRRRSPPRKTRRCRRRRESSGISSASCTCRSWARPPPILGRAPPSRGGRPRPSRPSAPPCPASARRWRRACPSA